MVTNSTRVDVTVTVGTRPVLVRSDAALDVGSTVAGVDAAEVLMMVAPCGADGAAGAPNHEAWGA